MEIREYTEYRESEIIRLYDSVGWTAYTADPEKLRKGFENSLIVLAAYDGEELVGIIRAVGDGYTVVYIQDILVSPGHWRKRIGRSLTEAVTERYRDVRQVILMTDDNPERRAFYDALGFSEVSEIGCCTFIKMRGV
jgi:ribosomal protein S18 acetylase RimI-like enzyme